MFTFDANAIYTLSELREKLHGVVELDTFMERLGLKENRVFRDALTGHEVLEALKRARPYREIGQGAVVDLGARAGGGRGGRLSGVRKLSARDLES